MSEASLRALEIVGAGPHDIHVAGCDDFQPRFGAFAHVLLPDLDTEAPRETTPLLGHCDPGGQPRDRNTPKIETRRIPELQTLGNHET